jgi:hypothetical protein
MNSIYVYAPSCNNVLTYLAVMCIFVIYKYLSWDGNQQQDLGKPSQKKWPSQAIDGKLLSILSHVVSEKTQSALRREQGWTHSLQCCFSLATKYILYWIL